MRCNMADSSQEREYANGLALERVPIQMNRNRALASLFVRIFYGEPVST
jgi:hypothetical protein